LIDTVSKALSIIGLHDTGRWYPFSFTMLDRIMYLNANVYNPKQSAVVLYSPQICPKNTVGMIVGSYSWEYWIRNISPSLEILSLRYTTDDKNENAIREIVYRNQNKDFDRIIRVMRNPHWELFVDSRPNLSDKKIIVNDRNIYVAGNQQHFEAAHSFTKIKGKQVKNYFTFDNMIQFANNYGCPFDKDEFWKSNSLMYIYCPCPDVLENLQNPGTGVEN
jgi:hypothetical protein